MSVMSIGPLRLLVLVPFSLMIAVLSCISTRQETRLPPGSSVADPGVRGPYAVGVTWRSAQRTLSSGQSWTVVSFIWYPALSGAQLLSDPELLATPDAPPSADVAHPLIIFSHGHAAPPQMSSFFPSHLASYGFVVAAPVHDDCPSRACPPPEARFSDNIRRVDDVESVLTSVLGLSAGDDPLLRNMVDADRLGMSGWSLGGDTTLRLMEADQRFRAGLVLAPVTSDLPTPDPAKVSKPMLFVQGALDSQIPFAETEAFFNGIPLTAPDHWFIAIPHTGHLFTNICYEDIPLVLLPYSEMLPQERVTGIVDRWGTAFLLRYVAGDERYAPLLDPASANSMEYVVIHSRAGVTASPLPMVLPVPEVPTALRATQAALREPKCHVWRLIW
jgi:predicted dienelactone hydrolase